MTSFRIFCLEFSIIRCLVFFLTALCIGASQSNASNKQLLFGTNSKILLKQAAENTDYLLEFVDISSPRNNAMELVVARLEGELQTQVKVLKLNGNKENIKLFNLVGGNEGNHLPFFYNRQTGQSISGPTPYFNLKRWATGHPLHQFELLPVVESKTKNVGSRPNELWTDSLIRKLVRMRDKHNNHK